MNRILIRNLLIIQDVYHKRRPVVPGCAGCAMAHPDLADQLTLFQPGGTDYAHVITTGTPGFSDLPTALTGLTLIQLLDIRLSGYSKIPDIIQSSYVFLKKNVYLPI